MKPLAIGALAQAALGRAGGRARVLARLTASTWLTAAGEILWLGGTTGTLHPRAILTAACDPLALEISVDARGLLPWQPSLPPPESLGRDALQQAWRRLVAAAGLLGPPGGLGALLTGAPLPFPLAGARSAAGALARACARDDPAAAREAALALLGLGEGLTPSGDDYVGGALFARHLLAGGAGRSAPAWREVREAVLTVAPARTHPISVALLGDLATGLGWASLHDLVAALADRDDRRALEAAGRLTSLGHTSGWDLLAGLGAGLGELAGTTPA